MATTIKRTDNKMQKYNSLESKVHSYSKRMTAFLGGPGIFAAFLWGVAEGSFFFIVPDVIITAAALFSPRKSWKHVVAVLTGSLIAGSALFYWSTSDPEKSLNTVMQVPFVRQKMVTKVKEEFKQHGAFALCLGPSSGIPYKLYSVLAPSYTTFTKFIIVSIPARLERFIITWILFACLGALLRHYNKETEKSSLIIFTAYWMAVYIYYWIVI